MELEMVKSKSKRKDWKPKKNKSKQNPQVSESEANIAPEEQNQVEKVESGTTKCPKSEQEIVQNDNFLEEDSDVLIPSTAKDDELEPDSESADETFENGSQLESKLKSKASVEETTGKHVPVTSNDQDQPRTSCIETPQKEEISEISSKTNENVPQFASPSSGEISQQEQKPPADGNDVINASPENELFSSAGCVITTIADETGEQDACILQASSVSLIINSNGSNADEPAEVVHCDIIIEDKNVTEDAVDSIKVIEDKISEIDIKNLDIKPPENVSPEVQKELDFCPELQKSFNEHHIQTSISSAVLIGSEIFPKPSAPLMTDSDSEQDTFRKLQAAIKFPSKVPSIQKLPEIKPFVTEYTIQSFPKIPPSKITNPQEKVPLKVNWNDLTLKFDLDIIDNLNDECLTNIEYYNMILREDLLPPRNVKKSIKCSSESKTVPGNNCENLKTTSDSMKNLYSDASLLRRSELSHMTYTYGNQEHPYGQSSQNNDYSFFPSDLESYALRERCDHYKRDHLGMLTPEIKEKSSRAKVSSPLSLIRDKTKQIFARAKHVLKAAFNFNSNRKPEDGTSPPTPPPRGTLEIHSGIQGSFKPRNSSSPRKRMFTRKQTDQRKSLRNFPKSLYAPDDGQEGSSGSEVKNEPCTSNSNAVSGVEFGIGRGRADEAKE
ncbi:unnamed protein product [Allacma fusca]|uniref:Uncharacterized protein n=1 Tax=Allacma fusca TaxID=39272 RepID=A0A8J2LCK8_9HEXA|nr:unnamed protein product [Allacma fusca]